MIKAFPSGRRDSRLGCDRRYVRSYFLLFLANPKCQLFSYSAAVRHLPVSRPARLAHHGVPAHFRVHQRLRRPGERFLGVATLAATGATLLHSVHRSHAVTARLHRVREEVRLLLRIECGKYTLRAHKVLAGSVDVDRARFFSSSNSVAICTCQSSLLCLRCSPSNRQSSSSRAT